MVITSEQGWVCIFGCTYYGPRNTNHYREVHPEYWQRRIAVEDRVIISCGDDELWRWLRVAPDGHVVADGAQGYPDVDDCQAAAIRINAKPYILELRAASGATPDLQGRLENPPEDAA